MSEAVTQSLIPASALVGNAFTLLQWFLVSRVTVSTEASDYKGYHDRVIEQEQEEGDEGDTFDNIIKCAEIWNAVSLRATSFLFTEYKYLSVFMGALSLVTFLFLRSVKGFSTKKLE